MHPNRHVRSQQRHTVRQIRKTDAYAFFDLLMDEATLDQVESLLPVHRERLLPPTETLAMFMAQTLNADRSCQNAINERPVFLYYGQDDQVLLPQENVLHIAPLIRTLAGITMIPKAGHYVFLAPCSPQLSKGAPDLCKDPLGVDRVAAHQNINASALAFFRKTLGVKTH